jgi:hypothetical protein
MRRVPHRSHGVMDRQVDRPEWPLALAMKIDRLARRLWPGQVMPPCLRRVGVRAGVTAALLVAAVCTRAPAQGVGLFLQHDRLAEYAGGAGLNLLSRGPWIARGWRRAPIRFVGVQLTSYAYERLFDYRGFSWSDYRQRLYGYLVTETVIELGRLTFHHRRH